MESVYLGLTSGIDGSSYKPLRLVRVTLFSWRNAMIAYIAFGGARFSAGPKAV